MSEFTVIDVKKILNSLQNKKNGSFITFGIYIFYDFIFLYLKQFVVLLVNCYNV